MKAVNSATCTAQFHAHRVHVSVCVLSVTGCKCLRSTGHCAICWKTKTVCVRARASFRPATVHGQLNRPDRKLPSLNERPLRNVNVIKDGTQRPRHPKNYIFEAIVFVSASDWLVSPRAPCMKRPSSSLTETSPLMTLYVSGARERCYNQASLTNATLSATTTISFKVFAHQRESPRYCCLSKTPSLRASVFKPSSICIDLFVATQKMYHC